MEPKWTEEQLAVIKHRDDNMLVSAAAGSGKTAVLIERVMGRLLDERAPINIDEDTWDLIDLALDTHGEYDGWETVLVK